MRVALLLRLKKSIAILMTCQFCREISNVMFWLEAERPDLAKEAFIESLLIYTPSQKHRRWVDTIAESFGLTTDDLWL